MLTTDTFPVKGPATVGSKVTSKEVFFPAGRVSGSESPLRLNPDPDRVACVMVMLPVPVLVSRTGRVLALLVITFPKLVLAGVAESVSMVPVPATEIVVGELSALLANTMLPSTLPVTVGENVALNVERDPGVKVRGRESPLILNAFPVTEDWVTVTLAVPLFFRVIFLTFWFPTPTKPNLMLVGLGVS